MLDWTDTGPNSGYATTRLRDNYWIEANKAQMTIGPDSFSKQFESYEQAKDYCQQHYNRIVTEMAQGATINPPAEHTRTDLHVRAIAARDWTMTIVAFVVGFGAGAVLF